MERTNINKVYVVGTVEEVNTEVREGNGKKFITGKVVIKVVDDNKKESLVETKVLAFEKNKKGETSKVYTAFSRLDGYLGKRVRATCELRDDAMVRGDGTVTHFNTIMLKFIGDARSEEVDAARFEFSGFVVKGLYERRNSQDELLGYRLEVAQQNYNGTNMNVIRFDIDKNDTSIASAIEANYTLGATIQFEGSISYTTTVETKVAEVAFGEATPKTYVKVDKTYRITAGNEPFDDDNPGTYTNDEIKNLVAAYKQADIDRIAKTKIANEEPVGAAAMNKLTRSLI